ncbi:RagB/SusD family nutrient uptake outer membrane protein [Pseudoflavitalea sp. X16]|uniref:RagB/SusD family nutrient uptake outer membrane protein n=1 Tax=Paraflavitalea devenefica TaxID=2716334 RepID=UPI00141FC577|nr:RagB/SusD family nutrient uptake outer membrane protein [Paraflavitalea devenefica]NII28119.1 RagB/SusD family nutrient uptake outer membrane protein [Paraflavitalea devenefica]
MKMLFQQTGRSLLGCLLLMAGLVSCKKEEDLLNPAPQTSIIDASAFDTPERVLGLVNGMYASIKDPQFHGGKYVMYGDFRGEEFLNRTANIFTGYDTWGHTLNSSSNEVQNLWTAAYTAINSANVFLKGLNDNISKVDATLAKQYTAEAKFVRAFSYFCLVTLYAKPFVADNGASKALPLRLQAETSTANNDLARSTVAEVYTQILKDLNEAETGLPLMYATDLLNTTRAHRNTAIALKTRVYLNMGQYDKVIEEGSKIVSVAAPFKAGSGVQHQLQSDIAVVFSSNYTTTESVFSMPMTDLNSSTGQNALGYIFNAAPTGNSEYSVNPSGIMGNAEWKATDKRKSFLGASGTATFLKKYNKPSPYTDYVPVIRYSEVLLNYAEAAAKTNDLPMAVALLSAVRNRSDPSYVFTPDKTGTSEALVSTIWIERRIEFLGEGFRSNDLLRNLLTIPAKGSSSLTSPAVSPSQEAYIFPLPNSEILTNKLLLK